MSRNDAVLGPYRIADPSRIRTPALAVYPDFVDANIDATLRLLEGDPERWRPHIKTSKLAFTIGRLAARGVRRVKCATSLELRTACELGMVDVLVAYPAVGANCSLIRALAEHYAGASISALIENEQQIVGWRDSRVGLFVDLNPGMDRTGLYQREPERVRQLVHTIQDSGSEFRGLHHYEGHLTASSLERRTRQAYEGYDVLLRVVRGLEAAGIAVPEVVTTGTPGLPCALGYPGFAELAGRHRISPGTVVYGDRSSLRQLPDAYGYRPAALVLSTVVSHPAPGVLTCDAGHKTVSADAGVPTCDVLGHPGLRPARPSEEHLPVEVPAGGRRPGIGETLYLLPSHICPTVNNFDHALIVRDREVEAVERVTARGREAPLDL